MGHSNPAAQKAMNAGTKFVVISDEEYIKRLRNDVKSNCYPSCEGTHALLREYDKERAAVQHLAQATSGLLKRAEEAEEALARMTRGRDALQKDLAKLEGDLSVMELRLKAATDGNFTDGLGEGVVLKPTISEQLQAELEPIRKD